MNSLRNLFEYQRFAPNARLQEKLDAVGAKYLTHGLELADDELDVAAAGEIYPSRVFPWEEENE